MRPKILTVTLNPAVDKTINIDRFEPGRDVRVREIFLSAGGKGINVSRALNKLKIPSFATGFLAGSLGNYIREKLISEQVPSEFIYVPGETRMSLTLVDRVKKTTTRILEEGPVISGSNCRKFQQLFSRLIKGADFVVFSGRNACLGRDDLYQKLILSSKKAGKKTVLDTSGKALLSGINAQPFMIKPNLAEAEFVLGKKLNSKRKIKEGLRVFAAQGIPWAVISLGKRGAVASDGKQFIKAVPPKIKFVNHVGCGDALIAGVLSMLIKARPFKDALAMGVAAGTANAMSIHPGELVWSHVIKILKNTTLSAF